MKKGQIVRVDKEKYLSSVNVSSISGFFFFFFYNAKAGLVEYNFPMKSISG